MKVGVLGHEFVKWSGGIDFLGTVINSLLEAAPPASELHLLVPDRPPPWNWRRSKLRAAIKKQVFGKAPSAEAPSLAEIDPEAFSEFAGRITLEHIQPGPVPLIRAAKHLGLDVLLPAFSSLGPQSPQAWVGYVYDFQHKYYPENFSPEDCRARDAHFATMLAEARSVIVNSAAVAADIARFFPKAAAKVFSLPFAPAPRAEWMQDQPGVLGQYGVAKPFFLISNQFWIHKDHATAFEAFRAISARRPDVSLVCTGITRDPRRPQYFPDLMEKVKSWGIEGRIRVLGQIPKRHQIEIMKHACAVLQPTRFEGGPGGGSVYDAVALDVPVVVSDLSVNREIDGCQVEFFAVGDSSAMASRMEKVLLTQHTPKRWEDRMTSGRKRRAACGEALWRAIESVKP